MGEPLSKDDDEPDPWAVRVMKAFDSLSPEQRAPEEVRNEPNR